MAPSLGKGAAAIPSMASGVVGSGKVRLTSGQHAGGGSPSFPASPRSKTSDRYARCDRPGGRTAKSVPRRKRRAREDPRDRRSWRERDHHLELQLDDGVGGRRRSLAQARLAGAASAVHCQTTPCESAPTKLMPIVGSTTPAPVNGGRRRAALQDSSSVR